MEGFSEDMAFRLSIKIEQELLRQRPGGGALGETQV